MESPRIDAHVHLWRLDRGDYDWLTPDLAAIHRDFGPDDLMARLEAGGFDGAILVQAAATVAETEYMLSLADAHDRILGVVGWAPLDAPEAGAVVERLARHPKLVGLRPMIHDIPDPDWMLRDDVARGLDAMRAAGLRLDALLRPAHLAPFRRLCDRHPDLPVVIDHCAKPDIAAGMWAPWANAMAAIARETGAWCKLSGLATEAAAGWSEADLAPYADHVLDAFGPDRVLFGSDWPVLTLAGDHAGWTAIAERAAARHGPEARAAVMGGTARRFYLDG